MSNELVTIQQDSSPYALMPVLDLDAAMARRQAVINFTAKMMVKGRDFGVVPGTGDKPTLLKPGAEKLASLFGLSPLFEAVDRVMDWTGDGHGGEPFFYVAYRCTLTRGEIVAGQGVGSCNSWEKKYRWRQGERVCPECGKPAIIKGKADYGGGWLCFKKRDGCGYKFADNDPRIVGQQVGQVKNSDPADAVNTIDKMAQKRALVAAVLIAVNASEMFTQDVEDYSSEIVEGDWTPAPPAPAKAQPQAQPQRQAPPATNGNDPGPLADDELTIEEAPATQFIAAAAGLLKTDTATLKARLKALGYERIPGKPAERAAAYRKLKTAAQQPPAQADWLDGNDEAAQRAALATAQGKID